MDSLIVEDLGKRYWVPIKRSAEEWAASSDQPARRWMPWRRRVDPMRELWALRNVSFRVEPGTILGVIGAKHTELEWGLVRP